MSTKLFAIADKSSGKIFTYDNIHITPAGKVFYEKELLDEVRDKNGLRAVNIDGHVLPLALLTSVAYKGYSTVMLYWWLVDFYYKDNNPDNITPSNIAHKMYSDEMSFAFEDEPEVRYKIIPGFNRYGINRDGKVRRFSDGRVSSPYRRKDGYVTYGITSDLRGKTVNMLRHRLLGLCYKEYPKEVDELDINHEDGIPGNDILSNIKWGTRTYNNNHAVDHKLNKQAITIYTIDILTGKVNTFPSLQRAVKTLKSSAASVCRKLGQDDVTGIVYPHHKYSYQLDPNWGSLEPSVNDIYRLGNIEVIRGSEVIWQGSSWTKLAGTDLTTLSRNALIAKFVKCRGEGVINNAVVRWRWLSFIYDGNHIVNKY